MSKLQMPRERDFGWNLKPVASSMFDMVLRDNGQVCVVLNHSLLRSVTAEMIHWWFMNFTNLKVRLSGVPGYEGTQVPAYLLWHPVDHVSATLSGNLGPNGAPQPGCTIKIQEAMQYDKYGWKYPVDQALKVQYVGKDGWAMGKVLPIAGPVMLLRIHYKDVYEASRHLGVHYHYEVVIGVSGNGFVSRFINNRITANFGSEFFAAWQRHNVIEVGTFENFLPALFKQREALSDLHYAPDMNPIDLSDNAQAAFAADLFEERLAGYRQTDNPHAFQQFTSASFL